MQISTRSLLSTDLSNLFGPDLLTGPSKDIPNIFYHIYSHKKTNISAYVYYQYISTNDITS